MVFESVVVDLLNRFLGDYVENLDRSQLQIGIWGGDVVLNNLELKQTALNDLDLPVQTVYGHLGKLVLKIPWKNLYGAPVIACVERLYLLAAPNQEVEYNADKEDVKLLDEKRKELQRIEAAKKKEAEKHLPKPDDSFVEKLATQIIKNVQLKIRDIHVRYEDKVTNPKHPFSAGVTLSNLTVETTDQDWKANIVSDALSKIFKIVELEGLAVYWNCNSNHMTGMTPESMLAYFHSGIATRDNEPVGYNYLLGPINSTARLRLNPKPDQDEPEPFSTPKVVLNLNMEKLSIALTRAQYQDLILLAESMDRMNRGKCYRKYRPFLTCYRGHYRRWWKFAYECILNEEVRRKRDNWCWRHMSKHRQRCRDYAAAYQEKLRLKAKCSREAQHTLDACERHLDLRNLVIIRQKIEVEVERLDKVASGKAAKEGGTGGRSWLASWWGGGAATPEDKEIADTVDIMKKFEDAMTPEEKKKLFRAIDYQENCAPTEYPRTFVENNVVFVLEKLEIKVRDDQGACVLSTELNRVECELGQRPAASAMKVQLRMKEFSIYGLETQPDHNTASREATRPQLVTSKQQTGAGDVTKATPTAAGSGGGDLLDVLFETNPLDGSCDQRLHLVARPLQILYDGQTINKVIEVFRPPSESSEITNQLQLAASTRIANMKEMSATGLQYAIQKQAYMEIRIDIIAPYFLVPYKGVFTGHESLFIMDLGRLQVSTRPRQGHNIQDMHQKGLKEEDIMQQMFKQSYDVFELQITDMQTLFALDTEDWYGALMGSEVTPLHLLQPTSLTVAIHKCLIEDDPRLPKIRVLGQLTSVIVNFSDIRLIEMLSLVKSLPIMQEAEMSPPLAESQQRASSLSLLKYFAMPDKPSAAGGESNKRRQHSDKMIDQLVQMTDLTVDFELKELVVTMYNKITPTISRTDLITPESRVDPALYEDKLLSFHVLALELNLVQHPYDMDVVVKLGGVALNHFKSSGVLNVISTPMTTGVNEYLFTVQYVKVDRKSPVFQTKHKCVEQLVDLHFTTLKLLLHQQGIAEILKVVNDMQTRLDELSAEANADRIASIGTLREPLSTIAEDSSVFPARPHQTHRAPRRRVDRVQLKVSARLDRVGLVLAGEERGPLADMSVRGLGVDVIVKESYTQVAAKLSDIAVVDFNKRSRHSKILSVEDEDALTCSLIAYNLEHTSEYNQNDMRIELNTGCVRVIFLNWFVTSVLDFLNEFQAAQQAIIDSAHEAAQNMKQNMKNAQQKATRIELKIRLKAPIVIVPVNSASTEALVVDLGLISISNRFICLDVKNDQNVSAVVDEMKLQLDNLQLCRVRLDDRYEPVWENKILRPTSFVLNIKRNLSAVWYNCIPDLDMSGRIKSIELYLRQDDLRMVMQVLAQNLSEGQSERKPPPTTVARKRSATDEVFYDADWKESRRSMRAKESSTSHHHNRQTATASSRHHQEAAAAPVQVEVLHPPAPPAPARGEEAPVGDGGGGQMLKVNTFVRFAFSMDTLILDLLTCKQQPQQQQQHNNAAPPPPEAKGLARFSLQVLSLKGHLFSDGSLTTSVLLIDCLLDDTRPGRDNKLKRYIERRNDADASQTDESSGGEGSQTRSMIDVTYRTKGNDMFADVRVFSFNVILSMDYLMTVADFFTSAMQQPATAAGAGQPDQTAAAAASSSEQLIAVTNAQSSSTSQMMMNASKIQGKSSGGGKLGAVVAAAAVASRVATAAESSTTAAAAGGATVAKPAAAPAMMTVNVRVEKPDIILVESMDDINCNAIILNNEIILKLRITGPRQVINGTIKDLNLYTCVYNPQVRASTVYNILKPCSLSVAGSTPEDKGLHLDLCVTDIRLSVSPATIELLNKILVTMTSKEDQGDQEAPPPADYTDNWDMRPFREDDYWFLKTEEAEEALTAGDKEWTDMDTSNTTTSNSSSTLEATKQRATATRLKELCLVSIPSIVVTIEAGVGRKTLPMILCETNFQGAVHNWSSQLSIESTLSVQMSYYNSTIALWEPFIELVEQVRESKLVYQPWQLKLQVDMNSQEDTVQSSEVIRQPGMSINVSSTENLELTITKTGLEVLSTLGKAFGAAIKNDGSARYGAAAPYEVRNDTGLDVTLLLAGGSFASYHDSSYTEIVLGSGARAGLQAAAGSATTPTAGGGGVTGGAGGGVTQHADEKYIRAKINELNLELSLPVSRADCRYFPLHHRGESGDTWGVISEVRVEDGGTVLTIRSVLQVYNHLAGPVDVYYMTRQGNQVQCVGTVDPDSYLNLPLSAVYTHTNEIFFSIPGYALSAVPFVWKDLQSTVSLARILQCDAKCRGETASTGVNAASGGGSGGNEHKDAFFIKAVGELKQVYHENTSRHTLASSTYTIHLRAALVLYNRLPVDIIVCAGAAGGAGCAAAEKILAPGHSLQMPNSEPGQAVFVVRLENYLEKTWSCRHELSATPAEFSVWSFESYDSPQKLTLDLGMHTLDRNGSVSMALYCPFWMLNKTGLMLSYRNSDESANVLYHPEHFKGPLLFSFRPKNFFGKKKASIRVDDGDWSDKFSLDVVGSSGVVCCTANERVYQIGVTNQLTYNSLTKQVMFTPYYVLINEAAVFLQCQEADRPGDPWIKVQPGECTAFWPRGDKEDKLLRVKVAEEREVTAPFLCDSVQTTLLRLDNKFGGVRVEVQVTEGSVYVSMATYSPGMAPALIVNHTDVELDLWEKESINVRKLPPSHRMLYTWENPAGPRCILFDTGRKNEHMENDLRKDDTGSLTVNQAAGDGAHQAPRQQQLSSPTSPTSTSSGSPAHGGGGGATVVYWVSFLDGMQRVLLFSSDRAKAENALSAGDLETLDQEITVSVHGVGLSLVNNQTMQEIMYMAIASSGVIWETRKSTSKRYKQMSILECEALEDAYQRYRSECQAFGSSPNPKVYLDAKTEIDLQHSIMLRPHVRQLRRTFHTGLWLNLRTSAYQVQLHAKVNRLQIDDQMHDCVFPVVLAPVAPPKSLADVVLKPFAELSVVQRKLKHSTMQQFKYCQLLVQEFHIKLDLGFINALVDMFQPDQISDKEAAELFVKDLTLVDQSLMSLVATQSMQEQKSFYDSLHFSPLKIHISFSMSSGGTAGSAPGAMPNFLSVLLQGIGVTLTDLHDVVFRLAYFQRDYCFLSQKQLVSEATKHYTGQAVKQLYVLVLGLDVIGNPFGLVVGITKGVEDLFYEPFQGAIQGPGEFAEGLVLGMRSLFGHTVGGAAGAFSRITGAMGKGLAALTFDKDYQRKRMDQLNKRPANLQEGLARSSKGLVMGVFDGVTGVFTKPISGAKEHGVEGFFKGLGKGAVGLVTRPTAGIVDFASGSFDAVKRATDMGDETTRLRPPRFLHPDALVRPYNRHEAEGNKLLADLEKGRYSTTDVYSHHHTVIPNKDVLLLTDKRCAYVVKNDIFGGWQMDWSYTWHDIASPVTVAPRGILLSVGGSDNHGRSNRSKVLGMFGAKDSGKLILVAPEQREELAAKMEALRRNV